MEACELTYYDERGKGETSDFNKEMELLRKKAELKTEEATLFVVKTILG